MEGDTSDDSFTPILYKKRWLMLAIFSCISLLNAYHWIHLNIISDRILYIWSQTLPGSTDAAHQMAVDWLSMVYLLAYIPFIVPATWASDRYGLWITTLIGVILNAVGAWIKCVAIGLAVGPEESTTLTGPQSASFANLMIGQVFDAIAQVFLLGVPAQLAATWFGEREIGTATSIGVLANQLGVAIGFAIPPLIVPIPPSGQPNQPSSQETYAHIRKRMMYLLYIGAAIHTIPILVTIFAFKKEPPTEPTYAQFIRRRNREAARMKKKAAVMSSYGQISDGLSLDENGDTRAHRQDDRLYELTSPQSSMGSQSFKSQLISILRNVNYMLLVMSYGIITGVYYALGTLLNVVLLQYFPGNENIGWVGFLMVVAGILGSIAAGVLLDRTKKYRLIVTLIYLLAVIWMGIFTGLLLLHSLASAFISSAFLGLTMTGFLPLGFEYAAELTYPANEGLTSGLLNASAQIFGIIFTVSASAMSSHLDMKWINTLFTCLLIAGFVLLVFIKEDLRRQEMQQQLTKYVEDQANSELNESEL